MSAGPGCTRMKWTPAALVCAFLAPCGTALNLAHHSSVDRRAEESSGQKGGVALDVNADENVASNEAGNLRSTHTIWIPSWPRTGSTTMFHMMLAAAHEDDFDVEAVKDLEDRGRGRHLHVPDQPPSEPGCWVLTPSGCHGRKFNATQWTRDPHASSHMSRTACEARRNKYNSFCSRKDSATLFVPAPDYKAGPFKRHFGLFEPCHKRYGNTTKPDLFYQPELEGNCRLLMDKLFRCNFTGIDYLWGWNRPHSDITGVTSLGAMPPRFTRDLAHRTCRRSSLVVYKTIDEFGRNASEVIDMLEAHPEMRAVIPLRDPRAIYASWKQLPWEFPGVSLLQQICDQMAENMDKKHHRLRRVLFERLIEKPRRVMKHVYDFLNLSFGVAQERWINSTFNASCSEGASEGNKFYSCHEDSKEPEKRWKTVLTEDEKQLFKSHPGCVKAADHYGFDMDRETWWARHASWFGR